MIFERSGRVLYDIRVPQEAASRHGLKISLLTDFDERVEVNSSAPTLRIPPTQRQQNLHNYRFSSASLADLGNEIYSRVDSSSWVRA